jgi:serine/threonine protein kinase
MAEVWSGVEVGGAEDGRPIAVKRILPHLCDELAVVEMFLSEARLAARLVHPNVVRTYDAGILKRQPYIAMELVEGVDLKRLSAASEEPLPIAFALFVVAQICEALAYVHSLDGDDGKPIGLIHRDVSPSNVMLVRASGAVKLLDFGVAKAASKSGLQQTRTGELKGKLGYMAPEVLSEQPYDQRADLFSVGVVLYELLAHERLFQASSEPGLLVMNLKCEVSAPSLVRAEIPDALDRLTLRALSRDPQERYGSAEELLREVRALAHGYPWSADESVALLDERLGSPPELAPLAPVATVVRGAEPTVIGHRTPSVELPPPRRFPTRIVAGGALALLVLVGVLSVALRPASKRPPPEPVRTLAVRDPNRLAVPDPWAAQPSLDVLSSQELALPAPKDATLTAPAAAAVRDRNDDQPARAAPPPSSSSSQKKRSSASPSRKRGKRHRGTSDALMGKKELLNPLAN